MIYPIFGDFNFAYKWLIKEVLEHGLRVFPRGLGTSELSPIVFQLADITKSLCTLRERKLAYKFNAAEKLCYITGNSGETVLPKYAPNIAKFINPATGKYDGAYGPRMIKQFKFVIDLLKKDKDSRQAIINIYNFHDDQHDSLDIPCTQNLHFLVRDGKLNLIVQMRSNDLMWGTPYDVSQFTFLQECFAKILGLQNGTYTHIANSLHIYDRDIEKFKEILASEEVNGVNQLPVDISTFEQLQDQAVNCLNNTTLDSEFNNFLTPYFKNLNETIYA